MQALGQTLTDITKKALSNSVGLRSIIETFQYVHQFLAQLKPTDDIVVCNDDLKGFYTSVPHDRIRKAVAHIRLHQEAEPGRLEFAKVLFTVATKDEAGTRVVRGKTQSRNLRAQDGFISKTSCL